MADATRLQVHYVQPAPEGSRVTCKQALVSKRFWQETLVCLAWAARSG
jgi:hypothetical protein